MLMEFFYFGGNPQEGLSASFLLATADLYILNSNYEFEKMFLARITLSQA